ncbi:MAG: hypothetical protein JWQ01_4222 [Massilia sp.]|nr:hypothetical protein [Massilia sp.]
MAVGEKYRVFLTLYEDEGAVDSGGNSGPAHNRRNEIEALRDIARG